ncbi:hypothetical protein DXG03_002074 [Asterophora parasitica]|uniref:GATA-type domain-containing protein n=1 Tax=Asterophora parasitica TaxID=117018 RepID=A0A9P7G4S7_9AGAR|nr:hypothetical protein DXG03_002074 [Asterophora parasitica]
MPSFAWDSHRKDGDKAALDDVASDDKTHASPPSPPATTDEAQQHSGGEQQKQASSFSFPSHFDSDKKEQQFNFASLSERTNGAMPHRVEPYAMPSSNHRRHYDYEHRRTPPPAGHSPTPSHASQDRSSVSTPPVRRSPPGGPGGPGGPPPAHTMYASPYDPARTTHFRPPSTEHGGPPTHAPHLSHPYMYAPPPPGPPPPPHPMDQRYEHHHHGPPPHGGHPLDGPPQHSPYHTSAGPPVHIPRDPYPRSDPYAPYARPDPYGAPRPAENPYAPQDQGAYGHAHAQGNQHAHAVFTDDAATKLSDRLCNKCGLFERTHSRPRPEQFPHKRGPLSSSTLRARTPPSQSQSSQPLTLSHTQSPSLSQPLPPHPLSLDPSNGSSSNNNNNFYSHPPPPPPPHHLQHQHHYGGPPPPHHQYAPPPPPPPHQYQREYPPAQAGPWHEQQQPVPVAGKNVNGNGSGSGASRPGSRHASPPLKKEEGGEPRGEEREREGKRAREDDREREGREEKRERREPSRERGSTEKERERERDKEREREREERERVERELELRDEEERPV